MDAPRKSRRGGARPGAGKKRGTTQVRPAAKVHGKTVYLIESDWEYLATWHGGSASFDVRELIDRARMMWPDGPFSNPQSAAKRKVKENGETRIPDATGSAE